MKKFEKLLEGIRTEEVRDAIECVHTECGRGMRRTLILVGVLAVVLAILAALAFAGFKAVDIILTNIGQRLDAVATIPLVGGVDERVSELERLQAADSSTMGGVYAEVQILWDEHIALTPTPEPASVPAPTTAPSVVEEARQVLGTLYGGYYDPMWEYLEYGETVEYFRPVEVSLSWMEGESSAHKSFLLTPPQWRALEQKLKDRKWEYFSKFEVIFEGDNLLTVLDPETGDLIWDASMAKGPRPLNSLEQWYMDYLMFNGWDFEVADVFDTFPKCEKDSFGDERCGNIEGWSPAEIVARGTAFENHAENPENGVWVEEWRSVDVQYRWVATESGDVLPLVSDGGWHSLRALPESGWIELQVGEKFAPTARFKAYPGFLACIDQAGQICQAGGLGWLVWGYEWMAYQTSDVLEEDLMRELPTFYSEALKYERGFYPSGNTLAMIEGYSSYGKVSFFLVKGDFEREEVAKAIEVVLSERIGGVYVMPHDLHFFDSDNKNIARWLDSRPEFVGWRNLKEDVRALAGQVEVEEP